MIFRTKLTKTILMTDVFLYHNFDALKLISVRYTTGCWAEWWTFVTSYL